MKRVATLLAMLFWAATPVSAADSESCLFETHSTDCLTASGSGDSFRLAGSNGRDGAEAAGSSVSHRSDRYVTSDYAPACTGNDRTTTDLTCVSAEAACADQGVGFVAYWRWEATVLRATGEVVDPPGWVKQPGSVCLGPTAAGVPLIPAISGLLSSEFQQLVVLKGLAISDPRGRTLVNYDTQFHTDARTYVLDPVTILGHSVVVTATPSRYDWYFGDGAELKDGGSGATEPVVHLYRKAGRVAPYVVVTWAGTFSVDGGALRPVIGTAVTTGPGTPLVVREARSQLVSGR